MNLLRRWVFRIGIRVVAGTVVATIMVAFYYTLAPQPSADFAKRLFVMAAVYGICVGIVSHLWFSNFHALYKRLSPIPRYTCVAGTMIVLSAIGSGFGTTFLYLMGLVPPENLRFHAVMSLKVCVLWGLVVGSLFFVFFQFRGKLEELTLAVRTRELERERAEKLAGEARLASLESRIHPHFLFNALNSVSALIRDEPEMAEEQIERISRFLRFALDRANCRLVSVDEEMKTVADYLEIERTRFGSRLRYSISVAPDAAEQQIPPFSVQTLVENSVKYAIARRREGGELKVSARTTDGHLLAEVWDDGPGFTPDSRRANHGLDLLEGRLNAQFGDSAHLHFSNGRGMLVVLEIPCLHA